MSTLTDNTAKWGVRKLTDFKESNGLPVGFEYFSTNPNIPAGSIPLFGGVYSREVYADLWSWVQGQPNYLLSEEEWQAKASENDGNVPYYSTGDGSTTFRVPSLKCWVKGANGIEEVGSYLQAGLPNITGAGYDYIGVADIETLRNTAQGAFDLCDARTAVVANFVKLSNVNCGSLSFDASLSNPIYGNSDTVQPKSIVGMWLVKAYGTVSNVGSTDVANIAVGLTELETRTNAHIRVVETYNDGTNWYRKWSDGWIEQGGDLTAPEVAWYQTTFLKPFKDRNYTLVATTRSGDDRSSINVVTLVSKYPTYFEWTIYDAKGISNYYACGMEA